MPGRSSSRRARNTLLTLIIGAVAAFLQWKGLLPSTSSSRSGGGTGQSPGAPSSQPGKSRSGAWEELTGCTLIPNRGNDGDSFRVSHGGREIFARLYFVDTPEKYRSSQNRARLADQGRYFGGLSEDATVALGEAARDFTLARLNAAPFTLLTRSERVYDSERVYAFITVGGEDLGELLVSSGLARIHTKGESRPGRAEAEEKRELYERESAARRAGKGGWSNR